MRMIPTYARMFKRHDFQSQSVFVTEDSLIRQRAAERDIAKEESYVMGHFMRKLIDRKYDLMQSTGGNAGYSLGEGAAAALNMRNSFYNQSQKSSSPQKTINLSNKESVLVSTHTGK
jgi:hypothetical protein